MHQSLTGPKIVPLERLLAIFYNIVDDDVITSHANVSIYTQITTLFDLGLLQKIGQPDKLDEIKVRCRASFELVEKVSKAVQFDIQCYLVESQSF